MIRGNLLALPISGGFLYVEPIYLQSDKGGSIPEMKRVILAYQDHLVMTENLGAALVQIFGEGAPQPTTLGQSVTPPPSTAPTRPPSTPNQSPNVQAILDQIGELRSMLDNLETQLKSLQAPATTGPSVSTTPSAKT